MLDIVIFDVELGQCVFLYPRNQPEYGLMVDCGNAPEFEPVDFLVRKGLVHAPANSKKPVLGHLVITNYDHDHFSGLPYLVSKVGIKVVTLAKNLSSQEIRDAKEVETEALNTLCRIKETYTYPKSESHTPPYSVKTYSLSKSEFSNKSDISTNNLSQMAFIEYQGSKICVCGDLERPAWELLLAKPHVQEHLSDTDVFVASHHGRENGYYEGIFEYCRPETIIISDKGVVHGTQETMSQKYGTHIVGDGVPFEGIMRKVLTTRSDGHIWIQAEGEGNRVYRKLSVE